MKPNKSVPQPLSPNPDHVYVKYNGGAEVWLSPQVAEKAIERKQAVPIDPPKQDQSASRR